jgi:hypothetical protein
MPLTPEIITAKGLTPDQVTAVNEILSNDIADVKKTYDGKANSDAEAILEGAAKVVETKTGITREKGQKVADYITLAAEKHIEGKFASEKTAIQKKQTELDELIRTGAGDAALKKKNEELQTAFDNLQKKEAEFDRVNNGKFEELYTNLLGENKTLKQKTGFNSVKPVFPDTVNKYEVAAKWKSFEDDFLAKYDMELLDGEYIGVSKENKHKTVKLADLVSKNEEIKSLLSGVQNKGTGANPKGNVKLKDVPFELPEKATPAERQKAIKDYLVNELKLNPITSEYAKKFAEFNSKILEGTPA